MNFEGCKQFILDKLEKGLPKHLTYHSLSHILDVCLVSEKLAKLEGVQGEDLDLLHTAALFHDSGFLFSPIEHEKKSCELARQYLPQFDFANPQINTICGMIMATKIPQSPQNLLEQIICDADLDYLGREDFWEIGNKLFEELKFNGVVHSNLDWNRLQVKFLEMHHYFTKSAITLRHATKEFHLTEVRNRILA